MVMYFTHGIHLVLFLNTEKLNSYRYVDTKLIEVKQSLGKKLTVILLHKLKT